jgi:superfamily II DNA helicase RecQ
MYVCVRWFIQYVQESGRAGRDGQVASSVVMYRRSDVTRASVMASRSKHGMDRLLDVLSFCERVRCRRVGIANAFAEHGPRCEVKCDVCQVSSIKASSSASSSASPSSSSSASSSGVVDVSAQGQFVLRCLRVLRELGKTVTFAQLSDAIMGRGPLATTLRRAHQQIEEADAPAPLGSHAADVESAASHNNNSKAVQQRKGGEKHAWRKVMTTPAATTAASCETFVWNTERVEALLVALLLDRFVQVTWTHNAFATNAYLEVGSFAFALERREVPLVLQPTLLSTTKTTALKEDTRTIPVSATANAAMNIKVTNSNEDCSVAADVAEQREPKAKWPRRAMVVVLDDDDDDEPNDSNSDFE